MLDQNDRNLSTNRGQIFCGRMCSALQSRRYPAKVLSLFSAADAAFFLRQFCSYAPAFPLLLLFTPYRFKALLCLTFRLNLQNPWGYTYTQCTPPPQQSLTFLQKIPTREVTPFKKLFEHLLPAVIKTLPGRYLIILMNCFDCQA